VVAAATLTALGVTPDRLAGQVPTGDGAAADPTLAPFPAADAEGLRALADEGVRIFVELGAGDTLTRRVGTALHGVPHVAVATDVPGRHGLTTLLHAVAQLVAAGVDVDLDHLHAGRGARPERWDDPPRKPAWMVNGHYARSATGASLPKGLHPADEAPQLHIGPGDKPPGTAPAPAAPDGLAAAARASGLSDLDLAVVTEYLKIVQGTIATGSEIVRHEVGRS
jgi:acyl transferase domain-containing protein